MDQKMKIFYGLMLLTLVCQFVHSNPVDSKAEDDDYLADNEEKTEEYDDEDDDRLGSSTVSASEPSSKPFFETEYKEEVIAGKPVTLKCNGENFDSESVVVWYNGTKIIASGKSFKAKTQFELSEKDGNLVIPDITVYDESVYRCQAYTAKNNYRTHVTLLVSGPPAGVYISEGSNNIVGTTLKHKVGHHNLKFTCNVTKARPTPKIDWIHNGNTILELKERDHEIDIKDNTLIIKNLHARHAGEYQCEVSNEYGIEKAAFNIEANYAPFFIHHTPYFNTIDGGEAELHCVYKAFPKPTEIKWMKGGSQIHENDKYIITNDMREHHDRTTLRIKDVSADDLSQYQCVVVNSLGTKTEVVKLGLGPAPAKFVDYTYVNGNVHIDYTIKSRQDIHELVVLYRNNQNVWKPLTAKITNKKKDEATSEWKVQGTIELEHGSWDIQTRSKNSDGWSDDMLNQQFMIKIPKESVESQNQTSSAVNVGHTIFGLLCMLLLQRLV